MDITLLDYLVFFVFVSGVVLFGCSFYFRSRKGAAAFTSYLILYFLIIDLVLEKVIFVSLS